MVETKRKASRFRGIILFVFVGILLFSILHSSLFEMKSILILGNKKIQDEKIKDSMGIHEGMNMFSFTIESTKDKILNNPLIESVSIKRKFPDQLVVEIQEKSPVAYVSYLGTNLFVDKNGQVIESDKVISEPRIFLEGLAMKQFSLGEKLPIGKETLDTISLISSMVTKYELQEKEIYLNIKNPVSLQMKIGRIIVMLGDTTNIDYKIRNIKEALKVLSKGYEGYYDLTNPEKATFKPLR